jgi:hypothetical protein
MHKKNQLRLKIKRESKRFSFLGTVKNFNQEKKLSAFVQKIKFDCY